MLISIYPNYTQLPTINSCLSPPHLIIRHISSATNWLPFVRIYCTIIFNVPLFICTLSGNIWHRYDSLLILGMSAVVMHAIIYYCNCYRNCYDIAMLFTKFISRLQQILQNLGLLLLPILGIILTISAYYLPYLDYSYCCCYCCYCDCVLMGCCTAILTNYSWGQYIMAQLTTLPYSLNGLANTLTYTATNTHAQHPTLSILYNNDSKCYTLNPCLYDAILFAKLKCNTNSFYSNTYNLYFLFIFFISYNRYCWASCRSGSWLPYARYMQSMNQFSADYRITVSRPGLSTIFK